MTRQNEILQYLEFVGCARTSGQIAKAIGSDSGSDVAPELSALLAQGAITADGKRRGMRYAIASIPHDAVSPLIARCEAAILGWLDTHGPATGPELLNAATATASPAVPDDIAHDALESLVSRGEVEARGKARARRYNRHIASGEATEPCHEPSHDRSEEKPPATPAKSAQTTNPKTNKPNERKLPPPTVDELVDMGLFQERKNNG